MTRRRISMGRRAEDIVASRLQGELWEIVERNARTRYGELDLVAFDGPVLVFLEVKAGVADADFGPERPIESIDPRKQRQVRRLATAWMAEKGGSLPRFAEIRFDAVGVNFDMEGRLLDLEHLRGAF